MSDEGDLFGAVTRAPSLVKKISEEISEAILSGRLARGSRLPSERELGDQFGVSRTVIREAVRTLAAQGLVTVTSGRGVEVAGVDAGAVVHSLRMFIRGAQAFDYEQIHELRNTVEVATAGFAARRASRADIAGLEHMCAEHGRLIEQGDLTSASRLDLEFHRALGEASGNQLFLIVLDSVGDVLREVRDRTYFTPGVAETGLRQHREILRSVAAHDETGAQDAMVRHLSQAESVYLSAQ